MKNDQNEGKKVKQNIEKGKSSPHKSFIVYFSNNHVASNVIKLYFPKNDVATNLMKVYFPKNNVGTNAIASFVMYIFLRMM